MKLFVDKSIVVFVSMLAFVVSLQAAPKRDHDFFYDSYSSMQEFIQETSPYVDIAHLDANLIREAYSELKKQHDLSLPFTILRNLLLIYKAKSSKMPKVLPARLVAECMTEFARSAGHSMDKIGDFFGELVTNEVAISKESLIQLAETNPTYFSYIYMSTTGSSEHRK